MVQELNMKDRTVNAIRRLSQSPDFKIFVEYLQDELDIQTKTLIATQDEILMRRAQGAIQHLVRIKDDIAICLK